MSGSNDDDFAEALEASLARADEAFKGKYGKELKALYSVSEAELLAIAPKVTATEVYAKLIEVVKEASRRNVSQAELQMRIRALGTVAMSIAKTVTSLAKAAAL